MAIKRRDREAPPQPRKERIELSDTDDLMFEAIHTHGFLNTKHLKRYAGTHKKNHQARLTDLYNGCCLKYAEHVFNEDGDDVTDTEKPEHRHRLIDNYLSRPAEQFDSRRALWQDLLYDLTPLGVKRLAEKGKLSPFISHHDHFKHRLMRASVMSSIQIACKEKGYEFISKHRILEKAAKDGRVERRPDALQLPVTSFRRKNVLDPDDLFGISTDERTRFFMFEADRGTEKIESDADRKAIEDMIAAYCEVLKRRTYAEQWGIPNLRVFIATTSSSRVDAMKEYAGDQLHRFHFKVYENFASPWRMPPVFDDVLDGLI